MFNSDPHPTCAMNDPIDIQDMFVKHRLRCTRQRKALYEALVASASHPSADELFRTVSRQMNGLSLATVYNTLEAFCKAGMAQKLPVDGGPARYDATVHNHLHLRCQHSGSLRDVPDNLGRKLLDNLPKHVLEELEASLGFRIKQVQIELVGNYQ